MSARSVIEHALTSYYDGNTTLVQQLLADYDAEREEATAAAATATPEFFQPGHTYQNGPWAFHCATVTAHPASGERSALGWLQLADGSWTTYAYSEYDDGWTDITGGHQ